LILKEVLLKTTEIILGLCVLHLNRVAHFDLKPGNILLDESNRLKIGVFFFFCNFFVIFFFCFINIDLADYGESRLLVGDKLATVSQGIGTYIYMAPELLSDKERWA
jgi:serine/threonine protein kinase